MAKKKPAVELELLAGERQQSESDNALIACNDWLRMGTGRTLRKLLSKYNDLRQHAAPTQSLNTLQRWSASFDWAQRAGEYDASWEARKNAERQAVMEYGLALDYERVTRLMRLAEFLEAQVFERADGDDDKPGAFHNVWVPDVKSIGSGDSAERVDIERFNSAIIEQLRGVLDDIAKEVGGRVRKEKVQVEDWRDRAIQDLQDGKFTFDELASAFGGRQELIEAFGDRSLVARLFAAAGIPAPSTEST